MRQIPGDQLHASEEARESARLVVQEEFASVDLALAEAGLQHEAARAVRDGVVPESGDGVVSLFSILREIENQRPGMWRGVEIRATTLRMHERRFVDCLVRLDGFRRLVSEHMIGDELEWAGLSAGPVRFGTVVAASWHVAILMLAHRVAEGVCGAVRMKRGPGSRRPSRPDHTDRVILECVDGGRVIAKQIASVAGIHEATVRNRVRWLREAGLMEPGAKPYRVTETGRGLLGV